MSENYNFPDFLFADKELKEIKNLVLSPEEQELFGLEKIYGVGYQYKKNADTIGGCFTEYVYDKDGGISNDRILPELQRLPYEYVNLTRLKVACFPNERAVD